MIHSCLLRCTSGSHFGPLLFNSIINYIVTKNVYIATIWNDCSDFRLILIDLSSGVKIIVWVCNVDKCSVPFPRRRFFLRFSYTIGKHTEQLSVLFDSQMTFVSYFIISKGKQILEYMKCKGFVS